MSDIPKPDAASTIDCSARCADELRAILGAKDGEGAIEAARRVVADVVRLRLLAEAALREELTGVGMGVAVTHAIDSRRRAENAEAERDAAREQAASHAEALVPVWQERDAALDDLRADRDRLAARVAELEKVRPYAWYWMKQAEAAQAHIRAIYDANSCEPPDRKKLDHVRVTEAAWLAAGGRLGGDP